MVRSCKSIRSTVDYTWASGRHLIQGLKLPASPGSEFEPVVTHKLLGKFEFILFYKYSTESVVLVLFIVASLLSVCLSVCLSLFSVCVCWPSPRARLNYTTHACTTFQVVLFFILFKLHLLPGILFTVFKCVMVELIAWLWSCKYCCSFLDEFWSNGPNKCTSDLNTVQVFSNKHHTNIHAMNRNMQM